MSKEQTQVPGQEKPQTGTRTPKRNAGTTINLNLNNDSQPRQPEPETQQHNNTTEPSKTDVPESPKPPIFERHVAMPRPTGSRETHYYSPLAATLRARFDANDPREQPFEHAVFVDDRYNKRGYI